MSEKKNKFRYSSPLQPKKLTLFRKTKENSSHDEDVFEQISKILDDSDLSTQETKYIAEDGKNDDFNENLENVEYEKNDLSFSKSKIEKTAHDFPEDKTNDVNLMSGEQKLSLQPISNESSLDRQFIVTKKCEDDKITEDVLLKECSKEKITLKKDHESLNKENLLTKVTDMSLGSRKKRMTAFDVCSLIFEKLKDNDDKITKLRKKSIKYEFRISEFKEKIRIYEKSKDELTKEKENIYNEKRLSDEKYEIVSDTYSSYRSDVTILIDSLRNNLDKTNDERNNLYNRNIEMTSEISSYKNKIEYINIYKIKIKEVGFEMLQEINNNYFNNFKCFDLMKLYVEECRILFELKKKCFVLDFVDKINVTGLTNLLNQVFSSTEELYTTYNDKLSSFYSLHVENKKNLTEKYREWNNKNIEELNSKIMEKEKHLAEFQDMHKNEIFKYEIKIKNMKEEFEIELESHKKTIDQLKSRKNNSKNLYLTNIIENINVVNSIIADIQNDFLLIQETLRDTKIHENSIKNSLKLKNRIKYKNLREKYKKLKNKKNKKVKKISYPSESDIWDVFK